MTQGSLSSGLSFADVQALLKDPVPETRIEVARKVSAEIDQTNLSESERALALEILRAMAADAETRVRQAIAETLKNSAHLPHDIAVSLAHDDERVSLPILRESPMLSDADLIAVLTEGHGAKQLAVAARPAIGEEVSAAVIATGNPAAASVLFNNEGAKINEASFSDALDRYKDFDTVKGGMVARKILPATIAERLVSMVSDKLKLELISRHAVAPELAGDVLAAAREQATLSILPGQTRERAALVRQLKASGRLTASLILRALCVGDMPFVEEALGQLGGLPAAKAALLIHDAGPMGLKAMYKRAGLPAQYFPAFRVGVDVFRDTELDAGPGAQARFEQRLVERILTQYQDMEVGDLDYLLGKLSRARAA
jgi:uncharacterized protein (DUF2336 family)